MKKLSLLFGGMLLLSGCTIEPDSWYCKQNGFTPGTEVYLWCLDDHAAARLQASQILMQNGFKEMQGP